MLACSLLGARVLGQQSMGWALCVQGLHLAATSFLDSACPRALVAGVNLTLRAETSAVLSRAGMLAAVRLRRTPCAWRHRGVEEGRVQGTMP